MKGVEIIKIDLVKSNIKGLIYQFNNRESTKLLLVKRKAGTISGGHYHTGKSKLKNPETIVFIEGKYEIILKNIKTNENFKQIYNEPVMFKIAPYIYHEIRNITDTILLDMNSIDDDKADTVKEM